jgi:glutamate synthase (ferredoxin)
MTHEKAVYNYLKATTKGVVKVLAKMGISTIQSYRGAQIFEAIGLNKAVVDKYFTWTASRIEGIGLDVIAQEVQIRHNRAYSPQEGRDPVLDTGGDLQWRAGGEEHLYNPQTVHALQTAVRTNNYRMYKTFVN